MRAWWWQQCSGACASARAAQPCRLGMRNPAPSWLLWPEVGWFQVAPASGSIRSPRVNLAYNLALCDSLFGITSAPDVGLLNTRYGYGMRRTAVLRCSALPLAPRRRYRVCSQCSSLADRLSPTGVLPTVAGQAPPATRIVFTNGGEDPWQWAGVRESAVPQLPAMLIRCSGCAHAVDLRTPEPSDPPELQEARQAVLSNIQQWLD